MKVILILTTVDSVEWWEKNLNGSELVKDWELSAISYYFMKIGTINLVLIKLQGNEERPGGELAVKERIIGCLKSIDPSVPTEVKVGKMTGSKLDGGR